MAMIELWDINRVLRWTGFRLIVQKPTHTLEEPVDAEAVEARNMAGGAGAVDADRDEVEDEETTKLGLLWVGLYGSKGWMKWEPWTRPFWARWRTALADKLRDTRDEAQAEGESMVKEIAQKIAGTALDMTGTSKDEDAGDAVQDEKPEPRKAKAKVRKRKAAAAAKAKKAKSAKPAAQEQEPETDDTDAADEYEDAGAGPEHGDTETEGVSPYEN